MDISGKLFKVGGVQTGNGQGGPWSKLDFVIEIEDRYPRKVCFSAWGDRVAEVQRLSVGDNIRVHFDINSREYNDKWYTDLRAWKVESGAAAVAATSAPAPQAAYSSPSSPSASAPQSYSSAPQEDDLPF